VHDMKRDIVHGTADRGEDARRMKPTFLAEGSRKPRIDLRHASSQETI
jgi:hypothetical protein